MESRKKTIEEILQNMDVFFRSIRNINYFFFSRDLFGTYTDEGVQFGFSSAHPFSRGDIVPELSNPIIRRYIHLTHSFKENNISYESDKRIEKAILDAWENSRNRYKNQTNLNETEGD